MRMTWLAEEAAGGGPLPRPAERCPEEADEAGAALATALATVRTRGARAHHLTAAAIKTVATRAARNTTGARFTRASYRALARAADLTV
jgi:hypothetical protein